MPCAMPCAKPCAFVSPFRRRLPPLCVFIWWRYWVRRQKADDRVRRHDAANEKAEAVCSVLLTFGVWCPGGAPGTSVTSAAAVLLLGNYLWVPSRLPEGSKPALNGSSTKASKAVRWFPGFPLKPRQPQVVGSFPVKLPPEEHPSSRTYRPPSLSHPLSSGPSGSMRRRLPHGHGMDPPPQGIPRVRRPLLVPDGRCFVDPVPTDGAGSIGLVCGCLSVPHPLSCHWQKRTSHVSGTFPECFLVFA